MSKFLNMDCMEGMKKYPDKYFDLAIVDPVYGDVTQGAYMSHKGGEKYKNSAAHQCTYHNGIWDQAKTPKEYFDELFRVSKNQIIWGGQYFVEEINKNSQCWIVWDKRHPEGVDFADCELAYTSFNKAARMFRFMWNGMLQENMKDKEYRIHPTQKPVALYEWCINKFANPDDIILDTHVGSGSSLIACHKTGHEYVGFEIDKTYFDLAKKRIDQETAQQMLWEYL